MNEKQVAHNAETDFYQNEVENGLTEAEREKDLVRRRGSSIGEAAVMYGEVEAERMGYVERGLKSRHIQFIALGGTIGTGLFLGIGTALQQSGPLSILLGYSITGIAIFCMMQALGELTTWLPLPGAIPQMCARYFDPAMGFAVGWNQWYSAALTQCAELSAAASLIAFWEGDNPINPAAWISILIVLIFCLNIFAVSIYGEAEFWFASIKIITILGLLLMAFIVDLGGNPMHDRLGFRYWRDQYGGAMVPVVAAGSAGRFLSFWSTLVNAAFSYGGVEMVAVAAGEAENPRRNIPKAVNRVFYRIIFFYVLGSLAIGVLVPANDPNLLTGEGARASPWVIGIQRVGIKALPSIINAVILTSATSSGNAFLYSGSRYLFALAQNGQAPKVFLKCTKKGVPYWCIIFTVIWAGLTYLSSASGSGTVFGWFLSLTTVSNLFTWISICCACIQFQKHLKAQGVSRDELPFKSVFQPYCAWFALVFFTLILIFNGWTVFTKGNWDVELFVTSYVGVPIYFGLYLFWKLFKRTKLVKPTEADLWTGKAAIDSEVWPNNEPTTIIGKIWDWIA